MSDEPKSILASLPLPGVLAILTAVAGTVLVQFQPLTPRRPLDANQKPLAVASPSKIDSTLMEDPFAVHSRTTFKELEAPAKTEDAAGLPQPKPPASGEKLISPVSTAGLRSRISSFTASGRASSQKVLVVAAFMRPFPDAASSELRARMRQSLAQALLSSGYAAEDPRFLECLRIHDWKPAGPQSQDVIAFDIPFEWFYPNESVILLPDGGPGQRIARHKRVLVLWLNNKLLGRQQIARLRELLSKILPATQDGWTDTANVAVKALGPFSTEQLGYLADETIENQAHRDEAKNADGSFKIPVFSLGEISAAADSLNPKPWLGEIELYSHAATGSAASVLRSAGYRPDDIREIQASGSSSEAELEAKLNAKDAGRPFIRTINTDDQVAKALINELERRLDWLPWHVQGEDCWRQIRRFGQVAIISEMDSPYGRELPVMYREEAALRWEQRMLEPVRKMTAAEKSKGSLDPTEIEIAKAMHAFAKAQIEDEKKLALLASGPERERWQIELQDLRLKQARPDFPRTAAAYLRLHQLGADDLAAFEKTTEQEINEATPAMLKRGRDRDDSDEKCKRLLGVMDAAARRLRLSRDKFAASFPWFPYIRGLDGRGVMGVSRQKDSSGGSKDSGEKGKDYRPDEEPMGPNQGDSLRRLAAQIAEMDEVLKKEGGRGIVAVGVLGSDVFDKLMIFRSLRDQLPQSLFFTNNLDAWLWDKDEIRGTRNLIVASPYGLALDSRYQRGVPPFRDSYQTAAFAAAMSALGMIPRHQFMPADPVGAVRLFEIGTDGPHELSTNTKFTDSLGDDEREKKKRREAGLWETKGEDGKSQVRIASLHPPRSDSKEWWDAAGRIKIGWLLLITVVVAVGVWWLLVLGGERHDFGGGMRGVCRAVFASTGLIILIGAPLVIWNGYRLWGIGRFEGEPFSFSSGISAWPAETLRMMAILLGLHFVWKSFHILDRNRRTIEKQFFGKPAPQPDESKGTETQAAPAKAAAAQTVGKPAGNPLKRYAVFLGQQLAWKTQSVQKRDVPSQPSMKIQATTVAGHSQPAVMESKELLDPSMLWREYQGRSTLHIRSVRTVFVFLILAAFAVLVFQLLGGGTAPVRGRSAIYFFGLLSMADLDGLLNSLSLSTLLLLTAFVLDTMWLSRGFIQRFGSAESDWGALRDQYKGRGLRDEIIDGYIDLRITGQLTSEVMRLAFFPFYMLGLLLLARISRFDNWGWPPALMLIYASIVALLIFGAMRVRAQADQMRKEALWDMQSHCDAGDAGSGGSAGDDGSVKAHRQEIVAFREGAFAPFSEQPTMKAVFWLIGAIGAGGLWQYLSQWMG